MFPVTFLEVSVLQCMTSISFL